MVLVDTSVWVDHLRSGNTGLQELLEEGSVLSHPFVTGELACGNLKHRHRLLAYLQALPEAEMASHDEVFALLEERSLYGRGIGLIDAHLLASALLTACRFWTLDKRLQDVAADSGLTTL